MSCRSLAMLFAAVAISLSASAATVPFRSGEVLSAELSTVKPKIEQENPLAFPLDFDRVIYAAVVVRLDKGRALSVHDYKLDAFGRNFPCIAIRAGDRDFSGETWIFEHIDPNEKYTMLFALDATLVGLTPMEKLTLKAQFPPAEASETVLNFTNRRNQNFTAPSKVPAAGALQADSE